MNDTADVLRACQGDTAAASDLLKRAYKPVFAYLRRLCGNEQDAADLTQRTFAKVWQSLPTFQGRSTFSTWVHGIAHHVYVDWRRSRRATEAQSDAWWETCAASQATPFDNAVESDVARQLYRCVEQLDENKRQVIHLHYFQHLTLKETAEALSIAVSTVKYRLREALDFLRTRTTDLTLKGQDHE